MKKRLEQMLFLVKGILQSSGVAEVEVGNLKHKDLMGHVVASQAYLESSAEESDGEEKELPALEADEGRTQSDGAVDDEKDDEEEE